MQLIQSRRDFLTTLSATGAAGAFGTRASLAEEAPPEVTTLRLGGAPGICVAPGYIAEELLRAEGFTDIRYIPDYPIDAVARGELDFDMETAAWVVSSALIHTEGAGIVANLSRMASAERVQVKGLGA
jgi:NitT/TauT family transport system substrate-binding protein